MANISGTDKDI